MFKELFTESKKYDIVLTAIVRAFAKGDAVVRKNGQDYKITKVISDGKYEATDPQGKKVSLDISKDNIQDYAMVGRSGMENSPRRGGVNRRR